MNPDETLDAAAENRRPTTPDDRDAGDNQPSDATAGVDIDALEKIIDAQDDPSEDEKKDEGAKLEPPR
jgi:hypothetical protein